MSQDINQKGFTLGIDSSLKTITFLQINQITPKCDLHNNTMPEA